MNEFKVARLEFSKIYKPCHSWESIKIGTDQKVSTFFTVCLNRRELRYVELLYVDDDKKHATYLRYKFLCIGPTNNHIEIIIKD
jgi:hypothetical protein